MHKVQQQLHDEAWIHPSTVWFQGPTFYNKTTPLTKRPDTALDTQQRPHEGSHAHYAVVPGACGNRRLYSEVPRLLLTEVWGTNTEPRLLLLHQIQELPPGASHLCGQAGSFLWVDFSGLTDLSVSPLSHQSGASFACTCCLTQSQETRTLDSRSLLGPCPKGLFLNDSLVTSLTW